MECHQLVERITKRITQAYSKQMSYAGRLQVITAILFSIYNFWGAIFILPQNILKEVDRKCKEFLWGGSEGKKKITLVAWEKVCSPKKYGGLNIKCCRKWNIAAVGKLIWQVVEKKDVLWVKWVNELYMKQGNNIWLHTPAQDSSWYWRKLNSIKVMMLNWYQNNRYVLSSSGKYSLSSSYIALLGHLQRFHGAELVWSSFSVPKHRITVWLAYQYRLLTKDRLVRLHIEVDNDKCCLCSEGKMETHQHLFAECSWVNEVLVLLSGWLGISLPRLYTRNYLDWLRGRRWRQGKKEVVEAVCGATIYHTWKARNWKIFRGMDMRSQCVADQIKREVKTRLEGIETTKKARRSLHWLQTIVNR